VADAQPFIVAAAKSLRTAAKVRALSRGTDAASAMTGRLTGYVLGVYPALDELAAAEAELQASGRELEQASWADEVAATERYTAACRRQHHAIAAALRAHRGAQPTAPTLKTCTCDNSLGSSVACRGAARLGEHWRCALTGEPGRAEPAPATPEVGA
jgi:hypothetical protein